MHPRALVALLVLASPGFLTAHPETLGVAPMAPRAQEIPHTTGLHGDSIDDPYFWMRDRDNPEVIRHLEAENAYTASTLARHAELKERLYGEFLGRLQETDATVPYRQRGWWHYTRTVEGLQYPIHCRRRDAEGATEEVVLDLNAMAEGQPFFALGNYEFSDDDRRLAYTTDTTGYREYALTVIDLATRERIPLPVDKVESLEWAADSDTLLYTVEDEAKRSHQVWRHTIAPGETALLLEEPDALFTVWLGRSRDRALLFMGSESARTSEARFLRADAPSADPVMIEPRSGEHRYYPNHRDGLLYIVTNHGAPEFRVVTAPLDSPGMGSWKEFTPAREDVTTEGIELFKDFAVLVERAGGLPRFTVLDFATGAERLVTFPDAAYSAGPAANKEFDTRRFRFNYQSLVTPPTIFDFDADTGERILLRQTPVPNYDPSRYVVERLTATATDGTQVPVSLVRLRETPRDGNAPFLLYGYGSYGWAYPVGFSSARFSLVDRGVSIAIAHIRGGGEMGQRWHDDGRMEHKANTFTDFIACARHLIAQGYTSPDKLAIQGGSAGGFLIGAVLNMEPELFRAAILDVPFVDVLNTMSDETLPLTIGEYIEWGNPNIEAEYFRMKSLCPYTNLHPANYPATFVFTSLNDSQVPYWESAKYMAKLRSVATGSNTLVLFTNLDAGHGGASGRYNAMREAALRYTFLLIELGIYL